ncbi:conjugal transfer protein TraF [Saccharospirillum impatiens]|uniref:conjugal transfer protein TraF n=1 Tax=Saccharospirillum impatiens TaxID=169438 RepID=UPI000427D8E4|nr:conjugal transfer protein TraF [Saccharospirillum impatiens]
MKKTLLTLSVIAASAAQATPFTGNDAKSNAMGNTGVASASLSSVHSFNPALLSALGRESKFAMTLPSFRFSIDDSDGVVSSGKAFSDEGGTIDQFETIDADAFSVAVFGDASAGIDSMEEVLTSISQNVFDLDAAIQAVNDDIDNDGEVSQASLDELNTQSTNLTSNTTTLDGKTTTANDEATNLDRVVQNTKTDFQSFDEKAFSLGLGADFISVSLPREGYSFGFNISNNTTIGAKIFMNDNDFNEIDLLLSDLTGLTNQSTELSGSMVDLSGANQAITNHIGTLPDPDDYTNGQADAGYQSDLQDWGTELDTLYTNLDTAQQDVNTEQDALVNYNGTYYTNGEVNAPTLENFESELEIIGASVTEFGVTIARDFEYMGEAFSAGVTPKLVSLNIFEKRFTIDEAEDEFGDTATLIEENSTNVVTANVDVGVAKNWPDVLRGQVRAGLVIKDLIPQTFETTSGADVSIGPKMRIGGAHMTRWTTLAADLDITENQPLKYGAPTRYLGLGAEFNAYNWFKLRGGYRNNLSVEDSHVVSAGFGFTPWGVGLDFSGWFKPKSFDDWDEVIQDAGAVAQFSMEF